MNNLLELKEADGMVEAYNGGGRWGWRESDKEVGKEEKIGGEVKVFSK